MRRIPLVASLLLAASLSACAAEDAQRISGTIQMDAKLQQHLGASDTLFIVARKSDEAGGPPLAVKRTVGATFPFEYQFAQEDVLRPGTPLSGPVTITAQIRKSGVVGVSVPGDMSGSYPKPVPVGAKDVNFSIDKMVP